MWTLYGQGFALGLAMILPLGPQNVLVMNQGIRRQYHLLVAGLCFLSDVVLIAAGVFSGSSLIARSPLLLTLITLAGVIFLFYYGGTALRSAWQPGRQPERQQVSHRRRRVIALTLAVTWLNPHVYLDTVVILGSIGGQLAADGRGWFAGGAITASLVWFFGLALLSARLSPWLAQPSVQRVINVLVGLIMWWVGWQLALQGWQHWQG